MSPYAICYRVTRVGIKSGEAVLEQASPKVFMLNGAWTHEAHAQIAASPREILT